MEPQHTEELEPIEPAFNIEWSSVMITFVAQPANLREP